MSTASRVCVVTGSRAEYGLLFWLMRTLAADPRFELQVAVTGSHLSPAFGSTETVIKQDGFPIQARVECLLSSDTGVGMAKSCALALIGFADAFAELRPRLVVVLGDRYEVLAAAEAAFFSRIPLAHISGGDVTEGALDDAMRHMLTKMATFHFVPHAVAARRVRQLGEEPGRVFNVGHLGLDTIRHLEPLSRAELEADLPFAFRRHNLLVTFHPATLEEESPARQFEELSAALRSLGPDVGIVFTQPNADPGGRELDGALRDLVSRMPNAVLVDTLGTRRYLSIMREASAVVGNSSSGILEAPSFGVPTVNIGDRQKGRPQASSIINCRPRRADVVAALRRALEFRPGHVENPYGDGRAAERIVAVLADELPLLAGTRKRFVDLGGNGD